LYNEKMEMITCSHAPDLVRCQRLCASVDEFVEPEIRHTLVVPRRDLALFRPLQNQRRRVMAVQDVVPGNHRQLPFVNRLWVASQGLPIRGWIMQQITKLSANFITDAELLVFADSDLQFVRPFNRSHVYRQGKLRLHSNPIAKEEGHHRNWHFRSSVLLGLPKRYHGSDHVGQLITWRSSVLTKLQAHVSEQLGRTWYKPVAHSLHFSEYVLYGVFAEQVLGLDDAGHETCSEPLVHGCWYHFQALELYRGEAKCKKESVAILLQSNIGLGSLQEERILAQARRAIGADNLDIQPEAHSLG
jgi:hypothetical protein